MKDHLLSGHEKLLGRLDCEAPKRDPRWSPRVKHGETKDEFVACLVPSGDLTTVMSNYQRIHPIKSY